MLGAPTEGRETRQHRISGTDPGRHVGEAGGPACGRHDRGGGGGGGGA